eukprot:comp6313_c0_seq1/m.2119 comp6313_c0_seq1/g.2119  ORF comp6313_c0_seq1/g.2119 comp6313_c0_seq1/m.2119 type:complete len:464 (-) comp6313_c0_seq1:74-1465(-)
MMSDHENDSDGPPPDHNPRARPVVSPSAARAHGDQPEQPQQTGGRPGNVAEVAELQHQDEEGEKEEGQTTEQQLHEAATSDMAGNSSPDRADSQAAANAERYAFVQGCLVEGPDPASDVFVANPQKRGEGMAAHVAYEVTTKHGRVLRRFRDFLWLQQQLVAQCPGTLVPPPPEKQALGRFEERFVEQRRRALAGFLRAVARHPVLGSHPAYVEFCTCPSLTGQVSAGPSVTSELAQLLAGLGSALQSNQPKSTGDQWFDSREQQMAALGTVLGRLHEHMLGLQRAHQDTVHGRHLVGLALQQLATNEPQEPARAMAAACPPLVPDSGALGELTDAVGECLGLVQAMNGLFAQRQRLVGSYREARATLAKRQQAEQDARAQGRTDKAQQLAKEVAEAHERASHVKQQVKQLSDTIRTEVQRFDSERANTLGRATVRYVQATVAHQKKVVGAWQQAAEQLDAEQ